jgi:hypothetical protein
MFALTVSDDWDGSAFLQDNVVFYKHARYWCSLLFCVRRVEILVFAVPLHHPGNLGLHQ